jgi:uncharacterized membrane protein YfcA
MQSTVGFGANVIAAPVLVAIDPRLVPGPVIVAVLGMNVAMLLRDRQTVSARPVGHALLGRIAGTGLGVAAVASVGRQGLIVLVALTVLAAVAATAFGRSMVRNRTTLMSAGALSGFGATTAGIGGPPVALVFADADGPELRGTLGAYFVVGGTMSLVGLATVGRFGTEELALGGALLPSALAGFACSRWTIPYLDRIPTRNTVLVLSTVAAVGLLLRLALG